MVQMDKRDQNAIMVGEAEVVKRKDWRKMNVYE
jgi:hypothetical protein